MVSLSDLWGVYFNIARIIIDELGDVVEEIQDWFTGKLDGVMLGRFNWLFSQGTNIYLWLSQEIGDITGEVFGEVKDFLEDPEEYIGSSFTYLGNSVDNTYKWLSGEIAASEINIVADLKEAMPDSAIPLVEKLTDPETGVIKVLSDSLTEAEGEIKGQFSKALGGVQTTVGSAVNELPEALQKMFEGFGPDILTAINPLLGSLLNFSDGFGTMGELKEDPGLVDKLLAAFRKAESEAGFGEFHDIPHESMVDPDVAHSEAWKLRWTIFAAKIALYAIGVTVEVASLGQIEGVTDAVRSFVEGSSWDQVATQVPLIEYEARLLKSLRYYYNREFTPEIPGPGDLVHFRVKEAILPEEFKLWMLYHGFAERFSDAYWDAHWILPSPNQAYNMEAQGEITETELRKLLEFADFDPRYREQMMASRFKLITRVDLRRLWQAGDIDSDEMTARMKKTGFKLEDARLVALAQIRQAQSEQTSLLLTNLKAYFKDGWINQVELEIGLSDMELPDAQKAYHIEDAVTDRIREEMEAWKDIYRDAYRKEIMELDQYIFSLQELGLEEWKVDIIITKERIRKGEDPFEQI